MIRPESSLFPITELEGQKTSDKLEQKRAFFQFTFPSPEIDGVIQIEGEETTNLSKEEWIEPLMEASRIRADSQNEEGISSGYYSDRSRKPKYKPNVQIPLNDAWKILFPRSQALHEFTRLIEGKTAKDQHIDWERAADIAQTAKEFLSDGLLTGHSKIEIHLGWPVVIFPDISYLQQFQAYPEYRPPDNTLALSFVTSTQMTPRPTAVLENIPFIAAVFSCPKEVIRQHVHTNLIFAQAVDPFRASPVLISKCPGNIKEYLSSSVKDHILALLIREKDTVPSNWSDTDAAKQAIYFAQRSLFNKIGRSGVKTPFYIGDRLERFQFGLNYEEKISQWFEEMMLGAFRSLDRVELLSGARELQLVKANFFSFFPLDQWEDKANLLSEWNGLKQFRRTYELPDLQRATKKKDASFEKSKTNFPEDLEEAGIKVEEAGVVSQFAATPQLENLSPLNSSEMPQDLTDLSDAGVDKK